MNKEPRINSVEDSQADQAYEESILQAIDIANEGRLAVAEDEVIDNVVVLPRSSTEKKNARWTKKVAVGIAATALSLGSVAGMNKLVEASEPLQVDETVEVTIHEGDTLWDIAKGVGGDTTKVLKWIEDTNGLDMSYGNYIVPGQKITIPRIK